MKKIILSVCIALSILLLLAAPAAASEYKSKSDIYRTWNDAPPAAAQKRGTSVPSLLVRIRGCESHHNYTAQNKRSSASGAYQVIKGTWKSWSRAYGSDVNAARYAQAKHAPPHIQDLVATRAFKAQGSRPWAASRRCWGR